MSSAEKAALLLSTLENREFRILSSLELGMIKHEFVPFNELMKYTGYDENELNFWLKELDDKELIYRQTEPYTGYIINYSGYDSLALNALVKSEILEALGRIIGVGKEADVFEALKPGDIQVAVKFHRLGRTSFRDTERKREYLSNHQHTSWLYQSRLAAKKEYEALEIAFDAGVMVPKPIENNRHVNVMEYIDGVRLVDVDEMDDPKGFLNDILSNIQKTYEAGIIHSDLSEFNILVTKEGKVVLIDWPQYIPNNHLNAEEMLKRDVRNVLFFFQKKFGIEKNINDLLNSIMHTHLNFIV